LEKHEEFRKGLSEYLLTKFYTKKKKDYGKEMPKELSSKLKVVFDVINERQEIDFIARNNE